MVALDVTNPEAVEWFVARLRKLQVREHGLQCSLWGRPSGCRVLGE